MDTRSAWVLNLDAELELAAGSRYAPKAAIRAMVAHRAKPLASSLLSPGDLVVDESSAPGVAEGLVGRAFCPTPRAIATLVRAGAVPAPHPPVEVLREVNGRGFAARLGQTLPGGVFVGELGEALAALASPPTIAKQWRAKRAFGMAGRGQRRIAPGAVSDADRAFLRSTLIADGGIQIEPDVAIVRELAIHGVLDEGGSLRLGRVVSQVCDEHGQWLATSLANDIDAETRRALVKEAHVVASALSHAGYFGPFGVDAFIYRDLAGAERLQPRSEINARYSMGFSVGFSGFSPRGALRR